MGDEIGQSKGYYYNITTGQVEPEGQSKAKDLLGPFDTAEEAAQALDIIREREQRKEAEDALGGAGRADPARHRRCRAVKPGSIPLHRAAPGPMA